MFNDRPCKKNDARVRPLTPMDQAKQNIIPVQRETNDLNSSTERVGKCNEAPPLY
jgi:hypothetical protein